MGNKMDKPVACEAAVVASEDTSSLSPAEEDSVATLWSTTSSSMGTCTILEQDPLAITTTTTAAGVVVEEHNHGVLALQEAANAVAEQQQQQRQQQIKCFPKPFWLAPQSPLWLDIRNDTINDIIVEDLPTADEEYDDDEDEEDPSLTCGGGRGSDARSLSLWRTKPLSSGNMSSCSRTSALSSSSSASLQESSSSTSLWFADELEYTNHELALSSSIPTEASDLSQPRHVWIVTTATLPWMTGTAVNPLLRAASLWQRYQELKEATTEATSFSITLVLPWLCREKDRIDLYGDDWKDSTLHDQEHYIRHWLSERANLPQAAQRLRIQWYAAHYHPTLSSIFAVDDVCDACLNVVPNAVVVLEEPEHLNFYRVPGKASWKQRFAHVIGIVHTNYRAYAQAHASGLVAGPLIGALVSSLVRTYCDKVIKLSDALQNYALEKQVTSNVHGIRHVFLQLPTPTAHKVYFIGKLLWAKGLDKLLTLQSHYKKATGFYFEMDIYGSGPEQDEITRAFWGKRRRRTRILSSSFRQDSTSSTTTVDNDNDNEEEVKPQKHNKMPVQFLGRVDHAALSSDYKIFVNPSITEVLCTTTAEALAMGKFVIIPHHPSNTFFSQFPNCLQYHSKYEFCVLLKYALTHDPTPLSPPLRHCLTWDAATDRLFQASAVSIRDEARRLRIAKRQQDERFANFHEEVCKGTSGVVVRTILHGPQQTTTAHDNNAQQQQQQQQQPWFPKYTTAIAAGTTSRP